MCEGDKCIMWLASKGYPSYSHDIGTVYETKYTLFFLPVVHALY